MISESSKSNFRRLAGIITEGITLVPDPSGRSDKNTFSYFAEEFLLNLCSIIISSLDNYVTQNGLGTVSISQGSTKMQQNALVTKLFIANNQSQVKPQEYLFTAIINFAGETNTSLSVTHNGINQPFSLTSHHQGNDINTFVKDVVTYIANSINKT